MERRAWPASFASREPADMMDVNVGAPVKAVRQHKGKSLVGRRPKHMG